MDHKAETLIKARYRLLRLIGEGGVAEVWLAHEEPQNRLVALKFLRTQYARDEKLLERFRREATIVSRLNSPHIVKVYDVTVDHRHCFIVMEYVDGQDLKTFLRFDAPLTLKRALTLLQAIAAGIAVAHQAGLIHRDLKPGNVLLSKDGDIKITDFGIARHIAEAGLTEPNSVWGTSHYISPEQALGQPLSTATDIYSLGVMLYQMLTGTLPYQGDDPVSVALAHIQQPVPALQSVIPSLPTSVAHLVQRMMAKNAIYRPQDGTQLLNILESYLEISTGPTVLRSTAGVKAALQKGLASTESNEENRVQIPNARPGQFRLTPQVRLASSLVVMVVTICFLIGLVDSIISRPLFVSQTNAVDETKPLIGLTVTATLLPTFTPYMTVTQTTSLSTPVVSPTPTNQLHPIVIKKARVGNGPDAHALYLTTPPGILIDGNLSEWVTKEPIILTEPVFGRDRWAGIHDLNGLAYFMWDDTYLYIAIYRTDDAHIQTHSGFELHRGDSIELWLDVDLHGDFDEPANEDDFQLLFSAGDFRSLKAQGALYHPGPRDARRSYGWRVNAEPIVDGYTLEARIPWSLFDIEPEENMMLGYAVVLNDNDPPESPEAQTQVASNREIPNLNPLTFGNLVLIR